MQVSSKTIINILFVFAAAVWLWNIHRDPGLLAQNVKGSRIKAVCVENPLYYGIFSGVMLGFSHGLCVTDVSENEGVPFMVLDYVKTYSASIYRAGQVLGFCLLAVIVYGIVFVMGKTRRRAVSAAPILLILLFQGACSCLPERCRHEANAYDRKMAGYSANRFYAEPVGYYVAKVKTYSDVAEITSSHGFVYGPLNVRRPLLYDDSILAYQKGIHPQDSYWLQGTVILTSFDSEALLNTEAEKTHPEEPKAETPEADRPLSERIKPVEKKITGKKNSSSLVVREKVLAYMVLDGRNEQANVEVLLDKLKDHSNEKDTALRLIGHNTDENMMRVLKEKAKQSGFAGDVEMFNTKGVLTVEGQEVPGGLEAIIIKKEFVERKP